jgi:hypothetical protein
MINPVNLTFAIAELSHLFTIPPKYTPLTHAFEDMRNFGLAVRQAIVTKFERLPQEQRVQVYSEIYHLASKPPTEFPWGETQAKEHLPRLADALMRFD